ncbi:MAG: hypothetical protein GXX07_02485 [Wolinella succinogenes]|uniref:hypothetical protein n=1 Tax=Wolinella succinogenes TaxID=844 RepID=UPI0016A2B39F|nr:hypothetical protein [Wolinella succinogenes]NLU33813.1 hypothetical protein [Wolinella succinogenes]
MRGVILALCMSAGLLAAPAQGEVKEEKKSSLSVSDLVKVDMPNKYVRTGALDLSGEQVAKIMERVRPLMHEHYQVKMQEAFLLEKRIGRLIDQKREKEEIKKLMDEVAVLKREAMDVKLEVIGIFQEVLTPEQWQKVLELNKAAKK